MRFKKLGFRKSLMEIHFYQFVISKIKLSVSPLDFNQSLLNKTRARGNARGSRLSREFTCSCHLSIPERKEGLLVVIISAC